MTENIRVSVCMATYNGAAYIGEQLDSILAELDSSDEVLIVDDASKDDTVTLIESRQDARITVVRHDQNRGYVRTFEHALSLATGDVVFLADQDDVWVPGRRQVLVHALETADVAASNLSLLGSGDALSHPVTGRPWRLSSRTSSHALRNEVRILAGVTPYYGCAMAVRRSFLATVLPFPPFLTASHDLWIATTACAAHSMVHVDATTVLRRIHDSNASPSRPRGLTAVLGARVLLLRCWFEARRRVRRGRAS